MIDSTQDTKDHIAKVQDLLEDVIQLLMVQRATHDASKLYSPEKEILDDVGERLRGLTYGSNEYKACLADMKPMLDHHYAQHRHHPEHFANGINDMDLADLIEMLADWKAATTRHADGDILKSIEINKRRFGLSDQLAQIMLNTIKRLGWENKT